MNATPVYRLEKLPTQDMQSDRTVNPRPWRKGDRIIVDCTNAPVTGLVPSRMRPEIENLILRAVNSHDAMREALETLCKQARSVMQYTNEYDGQLIQAIANGEAALALAKGEFKS